jgi:hypothetical protein
MRLLLKRNSAAKGNKVKDSLGENGYLRSARKPGRMQVRRENNYSVTWKWTRTSLGRSVLAETSPLTSEPLFHNRKSISSYPVL